MPTTHTPPHDATPSDREPIPRRDKERPVVDGRADPSEDPSFYASESEAAVPDPNALLDAAASEPPDDPEEARAGASFHEGEAGRPTDERTPTPAGREDETIDGGGGGVELARMTRDQLYDRARALGIPGRSMMTKQQLAEAVRAASSGPIH